MHLILSASYLHPFKMAMFTRLVLLAVSLLLLSLIAIAGYAYSQIRYLSLPIPQALAFLTVVLPIITGVSTHASYMLVKRSSKELSELTLPLVAVIGFQLVYETAIATLALTYMIPPASLRCGLAEKWLSLYNSKNGMAIGKIQDALDCCGLNSVKDKAFPFQRDGHASTCAIDFGRSQTCFGGWRKAEQTTAGLLFLVAVITFLIKVLSIVSLLSTHSSYAPSWLRSFGSSEDSRAARRRLIQEGNFGEVYRDDEGTRAVEHPTAQGPRVQPSQLVDGNNEWRHEPNGEGREDV